LYWVDVLQFMGEFDTAIQTLLQATEYFPEEYEIEYRLAGLYLMHIDEIKGQFHLVNALQLSYENHTLLEKSFPSVWSRETVKELVKKYKK
jgi:hypothetical protein